MNRASLLLRIISILSFFCLLSDIFITYNSYYVFEKSGFGYSFWLNTLSWWSLWISICIGGLLNWRPTILLIIGVSPFIIKWGILELSGIQTFFYTYSGAKKFYFRSDYFFPNLDGFLNIILIIVSFIAFGYVLKEWLNIYRN